MKKADPIPDDSVALSDDGEILVGEGIPLSAVPAPLASIALPMTSSQIQLMDRNNLTEEERKQKEFKKDVRKVVTNKVQIRAGLFKIDARQLKECRDEALLALRWITSMRDPDFAREIVVAAREILEESRSRDQMLLSTMEQKTSESSSLRGSLSEGAAMRLVKALETE